MRLGKRIRIEDVGPQGYAHLSSENIQQVIAVGRKFLVLLIPYLRWDLVVSMSKDFVSVYALVLFGPHKEMLARGVSPKTLL